MGYTCGFGFDQPIEMGQDPYFEVCGSTTLHGDEGSSGKFYFVRRRGWPGLGAGEGLLHWWLSVDSWKGLVAVLWDSLRQQKVICLCSLQRSPRTHAQGIGRPEWERLARLLSLSKTPLLPTKNVSE